MSKKPIKTNNHKNIVIIIGSIAIITILFTVFSMKNNTNISVADTNTILGGDLTIIKSDVTEQMKIYPYQTKDVYMEVMAIRTSDGTIRTALNTCENCYSSGRGYYTQKGDILICQNCGTEFEVDQIDLVTNGCNPVSIVDDIKINDDEKIVIDEESFAQYEYLFENWKR